MATSEVVLDPVVRQSASDSGNKTGALAAAGLTMAALAIHGYHPYAEDGGVYLTGIKHLLHPELYPRWSGFATAHLRYELFAPMVAALVRVTGIRLMSGMLLLHLASIWATLFAAWLIATRCGASVKGRMGAVTLLALTLTTPIAGTSLMLMDPYVTARSVSTPCCLLLIAFVLEISDHIRMCQATPWTLCALGLGCIGISAAAHPLMTGYSLACVLLLAACLFSNSKAGIVAVIGLCMIGVGAAGALAWLTPPVQSGYAQVAMSRSYWFLSTWHWYELLGLIAPPLVLLLIARLQRGNRALRAIAWACVAAGATAILVAALFARASEPASLVARLQPLRIYQPIYILMLIAIGAALGDFVLKSALWRWAVLSVALASLMFFVQRQTFPASAHIEWPSRVPANSWEQGFLWIRQHTPKRAAFALDADYIDDPGEDSQNFRAIAERSSMPDYAKDGGIAAIAPDLTPIWLDGQTDQSQLDRGVDRVRAARLRAAGVDYVVLNGNTPTSLSCPYRNAGMKVCTLRAAPSHEALPVALSSR